MQPTVIHGSADMVRVLADRRLALGLTVEELDGIAGLQERYSGKLEHPEQHWGRGSLHLTPMGEIWIESLGLRLVLMTAEQADAINAERAPRKPRIERPALKPVGRPVVFRKTYRQGAN